MSVLYKTIYPVAQKQQYTSNDTIDFRLDFENGDLAENSVRISGVFVPLKSTGTAFQTTDNVYYDPNIGVHSLFQMMTTSFANEGIVETLDNYPRMAKMERMGQKTMHSLPSQAQTLLELCCPHDLDTTLVLAKAGTAGIPFSFAPMICLNSMVSAGDFGSLDYKKSGMVTITTRIVNPVEFFFGDSAALASALIGITNLKLDYIVKPRAKTSKTLMLVKSGVRQIVSSSNANLIFNVPSNAVRYFTASFQDITHAENFLWNNTIMERPQGDIQKVQFSYKNSITNYFMSYYLESPEDITLNWVRSYSGSQDGKHALELYNMYTDNCYGIGLDLGQPLDFINNQFAVNIQSGITKSYYLFPMFKFLKAI